MEIEVVPAELTTAASSAHDAASQARGAHGADHIRSAAAAMPGSTSAQMLEPMAPEWQAGIQRWSDLADDFADSVAAQAGDFDGTDAAEGARHGGLGGVMGPI